MECEKPVSRVLFRRLVTLPPAMAIHLGPGLLRGSSDTTRGTRAGRSRPKPVPIYDLAPGGVYRQPMSPWESVSSYLTLSPLPPRHLSCGEAVYSLWHFP